MAPLCPEQKSAMTIGKKGKQGMPHLVTALVARRDEYSLKYEIPNTPLNIIRIGITKVQYSMHSVSMQKDTIFNA